MGQNKTDKDIFFEALSLWDRPDSELKAKAVLPADVDVDAAVESAFWKALGNPSVLPM